jgi:hypothetical protein
VESAKSAIEVRKERRHRSVLFGEGADRVKCSTFDSPSVQAWESWGMMTEASPAADRESLDFPMSSQKNDELGKLLASWTVTRKTLQLIRPSLS